VNYHAPNPNRHQQQSNHSTNSATTTTVSNVPSSVGAHTFAQATTRGSVATNTQIIAGTDGATHNGITCHKCGSRGHYSPDCPTPAISLVQHAYVLTQDADGESKYIPIPKSWVLLDSQSSISVINSPHMVTNIRESPHPVCARTNGGSQTSTLIADFKNLGTVWYNPESIANILSLSQVRKVCRITMDTTQELAMVLHKQDGTTMKFQEHTDGLYYYDTHADNNKTNIESYSLLQSVSENKTCFVKREIELADKAQELYRKLGRPSQHKFEEILKLNLIMNCPVTIDDAKRALLIYGPDLATIKGKTTKGSPAPHTPSFLAVPIPAPILEHHKDVTLCVDFFFVQGQAFLHIISRKIQHRIVNPVNDRSKGTMVKHIDSAIQLYQSRQLKPCCSRRSCWRSRKVYPDNQGAQSLHCPWSSF
jgi:hypothetical protein